MASRLIEARLDDEEFIPQLGVAVFATTPHQAIILRNCGNVIALLLRNGLTAYRIEDLLSLR